MSHIYDVVEFFKKIGNVLLAILKVLQLLLVIIVSFFKNVFSAGSQVGSFLYFINTSWKVVKILATVAAYAISARVAADKLPKPYGELLGANPLGFVNATQ